MFLVDKTAIVKLGRTPRHQHYHDQLQISISTTACFGLPACLLRRLKPNTSVNRLVHLMEASQPSIVCNLQSGVSVDSA
ncbi:hypothetical protein TYRP_017500 [Tyrophagus putrescentiae]|nr:hypothetical protein TYRP_017500 [Tyrophagus putrescentiae]